MEKLIEKIDSYHLFNYLMPGFLFIILSKRLIGFNIYTGGLLETAIVAYFIGVVISRIGSLIISKILDKKKANYKFFLIASKEDSKIENLMQELNMYRTLCSTIAMLLICKILSLLFIKIRVNTEFVIYSLLILLFILFVKAYNKQNKYIQERIENHCNSNDN